MLEYTLNTVNIWFPDQKEPIYNTSSPEDMSIFKKYWDREKDRCINGFLIADGLIKISGWLYWHTVYWKIVTYIENPVNKRKRREIIVPYLRDVEWIIDDDFTQCEADGKFYDLVGARDFGKSVIAASRAGWAYTFFPNSESVISGGAEDYIKLATDKIEDGLTNVHPIFKKQRIANDWKKEVKAGWKDQKTNQPDPKSSNSRILVRNYDNGSNSMAANGTRPGFHLIDEIGTIPNLIGCVKDSDGCWWSGTGTKPSCLVMLAGTGGDMEVGKEAAEIFFNPDSYNMLSFDNPEGEGRIGRFISALKAKAGYKEEKTLAEHLGIDHPDLRAIKILVSNEEKAYTEWWLPAHEKARKSGNPKTLVKFKAYWPLKASDSFLVISSNNYNVEAAKNQKAKLLAIGTTGTPVFLVHDGDRIKHVFTDKLPITEFPVKTQDTDAPIVIWEFPIDENPPWGLYIAGVDPYRQDDSEYSDSLGAIYIYKRMHDIAGEAYQDMFVAAYVARPNTFDNWAEQARLLIRYYNAFTLVENDDMSFIRYMQNKGDDYYLCDQPEWLKDVVPNTTVNRGKGIHRSSDKVRNFLRGCLKRYFDDAIFREEKKGVVIREILGVSRVQDPMLLEEIIKFSSKDGNYDREVAASLAIALGDKMSPLGKVNAIQSDPRYMAIFGKKSSKDKPPLFHKPSSGSFMKRMNNNKKRASNLFH